MLTLQDLRHFWLISRPLNVAISLLSFGIASYIATHHSFHFLQDISFWLSAFGLAWIAATGYWINDVYDFRIDRINKPKRAVVNALLSVKKVLTVYIVVILLVILFSYQFLSLQIFFINLLAIGLLFIYASYLKRISVVGNLVISFLTTLVIIMAGFLYTIHTPLMWMMVFAFQVTLLREITKDIEDIKGDLAYKLQTLPIQIGIRKTKSILLVLYILFLLSCNLPFLFAYTFHEAWLWAYLLLSIGLVQLPSVYLLVIMQGSHHPKQFAQQSSYLKYLIFTGIISLLFL